MSARGPALHARLRYILDEPYGAARDIMTYSYNYTPHIIASVNNDAAQAIFDNSIVDDINPNDVYNVNDA